MDDYRIKPDGDGFEVNRVLPDGKTCFVGWFLREYDARHWIENRVRSSQQRKGKLRAVTWQ
jgi:hypothetical protein